MSRSDKIGHAAWNVALGEKDIELQASFFGVTVSEIQSRLDAWEKSEDEKSGIF